MKNMLHIETGQENKILRNVSQEIKKNEIKNYKKLGNEMLKHIKNPENWGVGLAAPQVGYNIRMIVVSLLRDREDEDFKTVLMINPTILEHSENKDIDIEWCLSVPWEKWRVARWHEIKLKYLDEKGKEKVLKLEWLSARIIQHEIDHLDGILFTDITE